MRHTLTNILSGLAFPLLSAATPLHQTRSAQGMIYDWAVLSPSPELHWIPCFDDFSCTMLTVPLDYENKAAGTTDLPFIKWSANMSGAEDILLNPGGPGASGVSFLIESLEYFQTALGTQNNIVSFDPRGVGNSTLDLSCFPGHPRHTRLLYDERLQDATDVNDTNALAATWARAGAFGEWCTHAHFNSTAKYANTVATATDMLHYTELLAKSGGKDPSTSQLWYYGASYGTALGETFATLFPGRVGRMILDGVVDGEDYYSGRWHDLPDGDEAVESFFKYCYDGGDSCPFWAASPEAIKSRYNAVISKLKARPLTIGNPDDASLPTIVTLTDYKTVLMNTPYAPSVFFPVLASLLVGLEAGNGTSLGMYSTKSLRYDTCAPYSSRFNNIEPLPFILCNDANGRYNLSDYSLWVQHVNMLVNQSYYLGEAWAGFTSVACRSLNIRAPESQIFNGPSATDTRNPILFMSNLIDPVTPVRGAEKMSKMFRGSRLLKQDAVGHCTLAAVSRCTMGYMAQYIKDGSLPPEGTVCRSDQAPFQGGDFSMNVYNKFST